MTIWICMGTASARIGSSGMGELAEIFFPAADAILRRECYLDCL